MKLPPKSVLNETGRALPKWKKIAWGTVLLCSLPMIYGAAPASQSPVVAFSDFSTAGKLSLVENASRHGDVLRLTPARRMQRGAAWFRDKLPLGQGFSTTFHFRLTDQDEGFGGADGFAFVIQNSGPSAIGSHGGAAGFGSGSDLWPPNVPGIPSSIAVFFDTCQNPENDDPAENYIGIYSMGRLPNESASRSRLARTAQPLSANMKDGGVHTARIVYTPGSLSVFLDDAPVPTLMAAIELSKLIGSDDGYVGFTAATGNGYENHDILSWSMSLGGPRSR
jgi:hypothetical protein